MNVPAASAWHALPPTDHRRAFTIFGLFVQFVAVGMPISYVAVRTKETQATITKSTLLLVGRSVVHTRDGVVVLVLAALLSAVGSVFLARPYVRSWITLVVAVPVAAVVGVLVLGVAALVVGAITLLVVTNLDISSFSSGDRKKRKASGLPSH